MKIKLDKNGNYIWNEEAIKYWCKQSFCEYELVLKYLDCLPVRPNNSYSGSSNPFYGKKHTEETKQIISKKIKQLCKNDEQFRLSRINYGPKNGMFGKNRSGDNNPRFGVTLTEETKKKISESHKGKPHTEETRKKLSEEIKQRWADGKYNNRKIRTNYDNSHLKKLKWCHNGIIQKRLEFIPDGFVPGRLPF